jgi:ceramide glucosyltransferase
MVTALYHGHCGPNPTLWSRVEALGISTDFIPGVLTARMMERGMRFGLGATLAVRRSALDSIGGFTALKDLLADDYELGARIARNNWRVELAPLVVETGVPAYHWRAFANHQLRWLRSTRDSRPGGYIGMVFTFGIIWAALTVIVSAGALWAFTLLSLCALGRLAVALSIGAGLLNDRRSLGDLWLIPLRDAVALALWVWSFSSDIVEWRGLRFRLRSGRLEPI